MRDHHYAHHAMLCGTGNPHTIQHPWRGTRSGMVLMNVKGALPRQVWHHRVASSHIRFLGRRSHTRPRDKLLLNHLTRCQGSRKQKGFCCLSTSSEAVHGKHWSIAAKLDGGPTSGVDRNTGDVRDGTACSTGTRRRYLAQ